MTGVVISGRKMSRRGWRRAWDSTGVCAVSREECKSWRSEKSLSQEQHGGGTGWGGTLMQCEQGGVYRLHRGEGSVE